MKKVMKTIHKKSKSPASKPENVVLKKPASKIVQGYAALTEATLAKLEGASDDKIQQFLLKLSDKEQMCLWKKFENQRKQDGTDEQYRKVVAGTGMKKKANACLKVYLKTGGNTKDAMFQDLVTKVYGTKSMEEKAAWQPLNYMLTRYGMKELKARVLAGTIECRKNPHDPRFPEFRELLETEARSIVHENSSQVKSSRKAGASEFLALANMKFDEMQSFQFLQEDAEPEDAASMVKSLFGKNRAPQNDPLPLPAKADESSDLNETHDQFFKDLETASALGDSTPMQVAALKLLQVKTLLKSLEEELAELASDKPKVKDTVKKYKGEIKENLQKIAAIEKKVKDKSIKVGVMKKMLLLVAADAKKIKQWIMKMG